MGCLLPLSSSSFFFFFFFFVFLQLFSQVNGRNLSRPSVTPVRRDLYHSSGALMEEIKALVGRHPDRLTMETITTGNKDYSAEILVVTYGRGRREIDNSSKFRILLVVPMENLNGRKLVEAGDLCERRNGRGVDLNRNWSVDWGKKEKDYDPYEENPGTAPLSEPETQIMRKLSKSFEPHIWVNVHSGMEALFMPYDHRNTTPDGLVSHIMRSMLEELNHLHCQDRCLVGSGGGSVGYLAHGTATDYMYDIVKVPLAFTFEIYGDGAASSKDCFRMFNPIDMTTFNRVLNDWSASFLTLFEMGRHQLDGIPLKASTSNLDKLVSIDQYLDGYLMARSSRYGKKMEVIELGMQEIRTYFRLFLLSSVLLLFMFCSRISKSKCSKQIVSAIPL